MVPLRTQPIAPPEAERCAAASSACAGASTLTREVAVRLQGEEPILLNHLSAPHCLVWSAITASCSFPGMFPPQPLLSKRRDGTVELWRPSGEYTELGLEQTYSWHDGLVQEQAGMDSMRSLFNCNYFVVSQVSPCQA
jgi:TAG lipase/steryl ester hydrolase/phospholipase A2/LPA acyltransferase